MFALSLLFIYVCVFNTQTQENLSPRKQKKKKKGKLSLKSMLWFFKCFQAFSKASRLLLIYMDLPFLKPVMHGSLHGDCLVSADVWALRWWCVLLSGLLQLERETLTMYNLLEFPLLPSTMCSFLFSYKNHENCSMTFSQMLHTAWWYLMLIFRSLIYRAQPSLY